MGAGAAAHLAAHRPAAGVVLEHPIGFAGLWERSEQMSLESTNVRVASIEDLIALKRTAGRDVDRQDIEALEEIRAKRSGGTS